MEITWTYNFLESIAFIVLVIVGIIVVVKGLTILWLWLSFKGR